MATSLAIKARESIRRNVLRRRLLRMGKTFAPFPPVSNPSVFSDSGFRWTSLLEENKELHDQTSNWEEKAFVFDGTYRHEVCDDSDNVHVVLLIGTIRRLKKSFSSINKGIIKLSLAPCMTGMRRITTGNGKLNLINYS